MEESESPLWMVSRAPALNEMVLMLQRFRGTLEGRLEFSRAVITKARGEFGDMIRRGEKDLHSLAGLIAAQLLGPYQLKSVVIGEIEKTHERFTLSKDVTEAEVMASTDL